MIPRAGLFATWHGVLSCRLSLFLFFSLRPRGSVYPFELCSAAGKTIDTFQPSVSGLVLGVLGQSLISFVV